MSDAVPAGECHRYGDWWACVIDDAREAESGGELDVLVFGRDDPVTFHLDHDILLSVFIDHDADWGEFDALPGRRVLARPVDPNDPTGEWELCDRKEIPDEWRFRDMPDYPLLDQFDFLNRIPIPALVAANTVLALAAAIVVLFSVADWFGWSAAGAVVIAWVVATVAVAQVGLESIVDVAYARI